MKWVMVFYLGDKWNEYALCPNENKDLNGGSRSLNIHWGTPCVSHVECLFMTDFYRKCVCLCQPECVSSQ